MLQGAVLWLHGPYEAIDEGVVVVHRDIAGYTHTWKEFCPCEPFLIFPNDTRTDQQLADALNLWEMSH